MDMLTRATVMHWLAVVMPLVIAPLLLFPRAEWMWVALTMPGVWVASRLTRGRFLPSTPINGLLVALLTMVLWSLWATPELQLSLGKVSGVVLGICVYFSIVEFADTTRKFRASVAGFVGIGGALALVFALGTQWKAPEWFLGGRLIEVLPIRLTGISGAETGFNANPVGGTAILFIPLTVFMAWMAVREWRSRSAPAFAKIASSGVLCGISLSLTAILVFSQSLTAWMGLASVVLAALMIRFRWALFVVAGAVVALAAFVLRVVPGSGLASDPSGFLGSRIISLEARFEVWQRALYGIQDFPITGMGMDVFRTLVHAFYPLSFFAPDADIGNAHNQWLQTALDLGLPGMVALVAIWAAASAMLFRVWRSAKDQSHRMYAAGLGCGLLAQLVTQMADAIPLGAKAGIFWWCALGLTAALYRLEFGEARRAHQAPGTPLPLWIAMSAVAIVCVRVDVRVALMAAVAGGILLGRRAEAAPVGWQPRWAVGVTVALCVAGAPALLLSWMLNRGYVDYAHASPRAVYPLEAVTGSHVASTIAAGRILKVDPGNVRARLLLAESQRGEARTAEALATFQIALERDQSNPVVHDRVGEGFYRLGNRQQAVEHWRVASAGARLSRLGHAALSVRNFRAAKTYFEISTAVSPERYDAWIGLGDAFAALRLDAEAKRSYETAIQQEPTRVEAYDSFARALREVKDLEAADEVLRRAISIVSPPVGDLYFVRSHLAAERGDFSTAEAYGVRALHDRPNNASRLTWLGDLYYEQKKYPLALRQYEQAAAAAGNPEGRWRYQQRLGRVHAAQGNWDAAVKEYTGAIQTSIEQREGATVVARNYVELGHALVGGQKWDEAESAFRLALRHDPANSVAASQLGVLLRRSRGGSGVTANQNR